VPTQRLRIIRGVAAGQEIVLPDTEFTIGREEQGMGPLGGDPEISRQHARFRFNDKGELLVEDLGSTNGTYVNGRRIHGARLLLPGNSIRVGMTTLELEEVKEDGGEEDGKGDSLASLAAATPPAAAGVPPAPAGAPHAPPPPRPQARPTPAAPPRARPWSVRTAAARGLVAGVVVAGVIVALVLIAGGGNANPCVRADNGRSGTGHFRFITSACENTSSTVATFPLHRGTSGGHTVFYVVTDDSNQADARARGVNYVPKLANAASSPGVQVVSVTNGVIDFPATVDFGHRRVVTPGPTVWPPSQAQPPSFGNPGYSPLIRLPNGTVLDAPQLANSTGHADKVVSLDTSAMKVQYLETEGRYEDKHVHYASFDAGNPVSAAIEDVNYTPALNSVPRPGDEGLTTSAREELVAFVNGPVGRSNPQRQGLGSTIVDHLDPHNLLHETPVLPNHSDVGDPKYAPMWDVHLAAWTANAIDAGDRVELRHIDEEVTPRVSKGLITGPNGAAFGPSGFVVNCPLISIDVP